MRALFRLDGAARRHPAVQRWLDGQPGALGVVARRWFEILRRCGDDVMDVLHDGQATACVQGAAFAYVAVFSAHVNVGFFQGSELADPRGLLRGTGRFMRHVRLEPGAPVDEAALATLVEAAYADVRRRLAA